VCSNVSFSEVVMELASVPAEGGEGRRKRERERVGDENDEPTA
jgi:hypothetical protein